MTARILLADDHTLFREMLRQTFASKGNDYVIAGEAGDEEQTLNLVNRNLLDILLLDYRMPDLGRLSAFCKEVARRSRTTRILLVSDISEEGIALEAAAGGVRGYILKRVPIRDLLTAIAAVYRGGLDGPASVQTDIYHLSLPEWSAHCGAGKIESSGAESVFCSGAGHEQQGNWCSPLRQPKDC